VSATVPPGLEAVDIRTDLPTRGIPIKWVMIVDEALPAGLIANATACMAAAVGKARPDLLGPDAQDATGQQHAGLPWTGCSILGGDRTAIRETRAKAISKPNLLVVDMPEHAQTARVYDEYLASVAGLTADDLSYYGVSLLGPRKSIDKLVGRLSLLR
jgi:hypothetical protein